MRGGVLRKNWMYPWTNARTAARGDPWSHAPATPIRTLKTTHATESWRVIQSPSATRAVCTGS